MIHCIVSHGGYVESCQIAMLTWLADPSMVVPPNAETAEEALKSLANDLLLEYLEEWLNGDFEPEEFETWVYDLVNMDSCNDGFRRYGDAAAPGPDHWWPYAPLETLRELPAEDILYIAENFDKLIALAIDPELVEDEEGRKHLEQYQKEYGIKYGKDEHGFHIAEIDYDHG